MGYRTRNPPAPSGTINLTTYDDVAWSRARELAAEWNLDLGLWVEYAMRYYIRRAEGRKRFSAWRAKRDALDPDLVEIRSFLEREDAKKR